MWWCPMEWELGWQMSVSGEGGGSRVRRNWKVTKIPWFMAPMKLLVAAANPCPKARWPRR